MRPHILSASILCGVVFIVAALFASPARSAELTPANPQPTALEPGLTVHFHFGDFGHVDQVLEKSAMEDPKVGEPLPNIDFRGGSGKQVFGNKARNLVGALISGYIRFPEARSYDLRLRSNDGARLTIGGQMLHEDPRPHPNRNSDPIRVDIVQPGWYPIMLVWYERKGSYALELTWSTGGDYVAVPPEHFGH
jgi:hypothetical protein